MLQGTVRQRCASVGVMAKLFAMGGSKRRTSRGSDAWRASVGHGVKLGRARGRERRFLRPTHIERWRRLGEVHETMEPFIKARVEGFAELVTARGGIDELTPQERSLCESLFRLEVLEDACFAIILRDGVEKVDGKILERLTATATSKRSTLALLGLRRQTKSVPTMQQYIEAKDAAAAAEGPVVEVELVPDADSQDATGGTNGASDAPVVEVEGEGLDGAA